MPPANTSEPNRLPSDGNTSRSTKLASVMTCDTERVGKESLTARIPENQGATDSDRLPGGCPDGQGRDGCK